jgi:heme/copper-type cytochrome/quinol oxidase subunit 2
MSDLDLFTWWAISISGGSIFLTLISIYLYTNKETKRKDGRPTAARVSGFLRDFTFVWVLLWLLGFYIFSIKIGSASIFAAGNILVEVLLIIYLMKNRKSKQKQE